MTPHILHKFFKTNQEALASQNVRLVVLIADKLAQPTVDALGDSAEVRWIDGPNRAEPLAAVGDADALLVRFATAVDQEVLEAAPNLKIVGCAGVGLDNIDIDTATKHGAMAVSAPISNIRPACEHVIALLLATVRQLPAADAFLREGERKRSSFKGVEIFGKTVGIVGFGHIDQLPAQRLAAFETNIVTYDPYANPARVAQLGVELVELEELMTRADSTIIHLLRTRETAGMFDAEFLGKAKKGQIIINAARSGLIDEQVLADTIKAGNIRGAGLDVYATEPCTDSPLLGLPETVCAPHLGVSTVEAQDHAGTDAAKSVLLTLANEFVPDAINVSGGTVSEEIALWLELARELGLVAGGLLEGAPAAVEVTAHGELRTEDANVLGMAAVRGLSSLMVEEPIIFVNAPRVAGERGVTFTVEIELESVSHRSVLEVKIIDADGFTATVVGALTGPNRVEKIVRINGRGIDMRAQDRNLFPPCKDVPGALGCVVTALGESGINIEATALSLQEANQTATPVLRVSEEVPEELVGKITEKISATHVLQLELNQF